MTTKNTNMVNMTENIIDITTTTNIKGWIWPKTELFSQQNIEEQSHGASKDGQLSQLVQACEPGLGDLSKPTAPAYYHLMFVVVV